LSVGDTIDTSKVSNPAPQQVYDSELWGRQLDYDIPGFTPGNSYQVRLDFAEIVYGSAGQDYENVSINGTQVLTNFDKFAAAGGKDIAIAEDFTTTADNNGNINIVFTGLGVEAATVQGIEIYPGATTPPPTVATAASANPNPVAGTTTALGVLGADQAGESTLTYTWSEVSGPSGVTFSANGSNAAKNTVAAFTQAGTYTFQATISDPSGQSVTSQVGVTVNQTLSHINVSPAIANVNDGTTLQYADTELDQFGNALTAQQPIIWSIASGGGTINGSTGLYTAPAAGNGSATIQAASGAVSGTAAATDVQSTAPPSVAVPARSNPNPVTGTTTLLSVLGADQAGESTLTYAWSEISGPAGVTFNANGSNAAKNTTATFTQAGTYTFQATISDPSDQSVTSQVSVTVNQTLTGIKVSPGDAPVPDGTMQQFTASELDQFGDPLTAQQPILWSIESGGAGTINSSTGLYTAPASGNGSATIQAVSGAVFGTATASDVASSPAPLVTINAGGGPVAWPGGPVPVFGGDKYLTTVGGGNVLSVGDTIDTSKVNDPAPQQVYDSELWGRQLDYDIPGFIPGNSYQVRLDFAEIVYGSAGQDYENVSINGTQVLTNFDKFAAAGGKDIAIAEDFTTTADSNGNINIVFSGVGTDAATVQGIEIYPGIPPTVATPATANPTIVSGTTTALSVLGADQAGESTLTYTWSETSGPSGVTFGANGTNAAKNTTATFTQAGTYTFQTTISDPYGQSVISPVSDSVSVNQTLTGISVAPASASVLFGTTQQFTATELDQFGNALTTQLPITWSIENGGAGTINSTGLYTAATSNGSATIQARSGAVSGTAAVQDVSAFVQPPTNLSATPGNTEITLNWTAPSGGPYTYNIYRSTISGQEVQIQTDVSGTTYTDTAGLTDGTTYYYYVTAVSGKVESNPSNQASATLTPPAPAGYLWDPALTNSANGGGGSWAPSIADWYYAGSGDVVLPASGADAVFQGNPSYALMDTAANGGLNLESLSLSNNSFLYDENINAFVQGQIGTLYMGSGLTTIDWSYATDVNNPGEQWTVTNWTADQGSAVDFATDNLGDYKGANDVSLVTVTNPSTLGLIGGGAPWAGAQAGVENYTVSIVPDAIFEKNDQLPFYNFVGYDTSHNSLRGLGAGDENNDQDSSTIASGQSSQDNVYLTTPQDILASTTINSLIVDSVYHPNPNGPPNVTGPGTLTITSGDLLLNSAPTFSVPIDFPNGGHIFMGNNETNETNNQGAPVHFSPDVQSSIGGNDGLTITGQIIPTLNPNGTITETPNTDPITFSGDSTYTGTTTINAADVVISNPSNFGDPTQAHTVVLNGYSILAPSQSDFLNSNYSLIMNAGSELNTTGFAPDASGASTSIGNIEFGGGSQGSTITAGTTLAQSNGTVTIDPGAVLNVALTSAPQIGQTFTVITGVQSFAGAFAQVNGTYGGNTYALTPTYTGGKLVLTANYSGTPFAANTISSTSGRIFFDNYDLGGLNVAYYTSDTVNPYGTTYRGNDAMPVPEISGQIMNSNGIPIIANGFGLGAHGNQGEWAMYTVNVQTAGYYNLTIETANSDESGSGLAHIDIDGVDVTGEITVGNTGGWTQWQDQTVATNIYLTAGTHLVRLSIDNNAAMAFNWMSFTPSS
jgi:Carbohydrate binding module (family 6)/Malectin domain/Fibronectin type III domain/Bacterial Ig-like domain (group 2)